MVRRKTKVISVRVNKQLYNIVKNVTNELNKLANNPKEMYTMGDTIRMMIQYFSMMMVLGEWKDPLPVLRQRFVDYLDSLVKEGKK